MPGDAVQTVRTGTAEKHSAPVWAPAVCSELRQAATEIEATLEAKP